MSRNPYYTGSELQMEVNAACNELFTSELSVTSTPFTHDRRLRRYKWIRGGDQSGATALKRNERNKKGGKEEGEHENE